MEEKKLKAVLRFACVSHAEYTSLRTKANTFAANNAGICKFLVCEDPTNTDCSYFVEVELHFEPASAEAGAALMTTINNALPTLPALYERNGERRVYEYKDRLLKD